MLITVLNNKIIFILRSKSNTFNWPFVVPPEKKYKKICNHFNNELFFNSLIIQRNLQNFNTWAQTSPEELAANCIVSNFTWPDLI